MPNVNVNLSERSYVISIGRGNLESLGEMAAAGGRTTGALIVTNPVVARHYADRALASIRSAGVRCELVAIPAGERYKTLSSVQSIYSRLCEMRIDRRGAVIALGGGVVGDMAGFAAGTYMRGIDYYQVPTTLLAQVDSSVGGKTGVDLPAGKNLVGVFHQPRGVLADTATLDTLPARELRSGLAEVVKHGIIYDQDFFAFLETNAAGLLRRKPQPIEWAVLRSVQIKRDVVEQDEREMGLRAILNFGHTVGHAIEKLSGYGKCRHGEASSIGMVTEALLAERCGWAAKGTSATIAAALERMKLPVRMMGNLPTEAILQAIELDKKTLGGRIRLALPVRIGECGVFENIDRGSLASAIEAHRKWEL